MTHMQYHMPEALKQHVLTVVCDTEHVKVFKMHRPGDSAYRVQITFTPEGIAIQGDIGLGANQGGICTMTGGYGVGWFSREQSEDYLCSKFLSKRWQREVVEGNIRSFLKDAERELADAISSAEEDLDEDEEVDPDEFIDERRHVKAWKDILDFWNDETSEKELHEFASDLVSDFWDYSIGYDYPVADAGWLAAIQKRFVTLYAELQEKA